MIAFIKKNYEALNLKITQFSWTEKFSYDLFDIQIEFTFENLNCVGRATENNSNLAISKAFSEALENLLQQWYGFENTNGISVHPSKEISSKNSICELIERDLFLCHFYTKTLGDKVDPDLCTHFIKESFPKVHGEIKIYKLVYAKGYCILVIIGGVALKTNPFGLILGCKYSDSFEEALNGAFIEALRDYYSVIENGVRDISLEDFYLLEKPGPYDHLSLARNLEYTKLLNIDSFDQIKKPKSSYDYCIKVQDLIIPGFFKDLTLSATVALSENCNLLFFGETRRANVNKQRLDCFCGGEDYTINLMPHPFG